MKIVLPKPYLSWSQLEIWEKSPERYMKEYFIKSEKLDTIYLRFGKQIAKYLEDLKEIEASLQEDEKYKAIDILRIKYSIDDITAETISKVESYDCSEYKIEGNINGVPVLSYIDSYHTLSNNFREYKTGKIPWTQSKVQKHGQLAFYASILREKTGKSPEYCHLDWLETKNESLESIEIDGLSNNKKNNLKLTGKIVSFKREFDERELDRMVDRITRVAKEISVAYINFLNKEL